MVVLLKLLLGLLKFSLGVLKLLRIGTKVFLKPNHLVLEDLDLLLVSLYLCLYLLRLGDEWVQLVRNLILFLPESLGLGPDFLVYFLECLILDLLLFRRFFELLLLTRQLVLYGVAFVDQALFVVL